jgi:hypothetical protein
MCRHGQDHFPKRIGERFINRSVVTKLMSLTRNDVRWLQRGKQRAAAARVLQKPMTGKEICVAARRFSPRIQLRDVWHLMQQMEARGLVHCRNPRLVTGRLYELTARGRAACGIAFSQPLVPGPDNIDWRKYSHVVRAKIRRLALTGLGELEAKTNEGQTATSVRKHLRAQHAVGLNPVIRAIKDMAKLGLIKEDGVTEIRCCKLYRLTPAGARILGQMRR